MSAELPSSCLTGAEGMGLFSPWIWMLRLNPVMRSCHPFFTKHALALARTSCTSTQKSGDGGGGSLVSFLLCSFLFLFFDCWSPMHTINFWTLIQDFALISVRLLKDAASISDLALGDMWVFCPESSLLLVRYWANSDPDIPWRWLVTKKEISKC